MLGGKKIAANTMFLVLSSLFNLGISLFTTSIIARSIGPELYGKYTFGLTYILMFSVLANFGLESLFIRETARDKKNIELIHDIFQLKIVLALITIVATIFSASILHYPSDTMKVLYILCGGLFFQILSESLLSVYRSIERMHITAVSSAFFRLFSAIFIAISIYTQFGFYGIVAAFSIGNALVFIGVSLFFRREFKAIDFRINLSQWLILMKQGLPFYLSALLTMFYIRVNIIMLSKLVSDTEIGFYMASLNLVENLYFIRIAFNTSIFPAFSRMYGVSSDSLKKAYIKITKYLIILSVAVSIGTILVSEKVISLIYGSEFLPAVPVLNILIFLWVFSFFSNTQSSLLFSIQKETSQLRIMFVACLVNIILSYVLIKWYGYIGAAYASVLTEAIVVILITALLWKLNYRYVPDRYLLRLVFVAIAMVISVKFLLQFNVIAAITGGGVSYMSLLFFMKVFDDDDIVYMKSLIKRKPAHE